MHTTTIPPRWYVDFEVRHGATCVTTGVADVRATTETLALTEARVAIVSSTPHMGDPTAHLHIVGIERADDGGVA